MVNHSTWDACETLAHKLSYYPDALDEIVIRAMRVDRESPNRPSSRTPLFHNYHHAKDLQVLLQVLDVEGGKAIIRDVLTKHGINVPDFFQE